MRQSEIRGSGPYEPGSVISGHWKIIDCIGRGREGLLYKAVSLDKKDRDKEVWIQEVRLSQTDDTPMKEAEVLKKKIKILSESGEGIVPFGDLLFENGICYYVMEPVVSKTAGDAAGCSKDEMPSEAEIMNSLVPVLSALSRLHKRGFLHRGITKDSVLITPDRKLLLRGAGLAMTGQERETRSIHLSEAFAASEIYDIDQAQGPWTDIYALTAVVYYLFTGVLPQPSVERVFIDELRSPRDAGAAISEKGNDLIMKGLALTPEKRFRDADEVIAAIRSAYPDPEKLRRKKQRRAAVSVILLAAVLTAGIWGTGKASRRRSYFHGEDTTVFYLYHEMAEGEEAADAETIRQCIDGIHMRIDVLAGEENYLWEDKKGRIRVELPSGLLGDRNRKAALENYIISPFVMTRYTAYENSATSFYSQRLPEDAFTGFELISEEAAPLRRTLKLSIRPEYADTVFSYRNNQGRISVDLEGGISTLDGLLYVLTDDGEAIRLNSGPETDALLNALAYDMTHDPLPGYIRYSFEHKNIKWQDPEKTLLKGDNQKEIKSYTGSKVIQFLEVSGYSHPDTLTGTEEEKVKIMLDGLSSGYAYGYSEDSGEVCFALDLDQHLSSIEDAAIISDPIGSSKPSKRRAITIQKVSSAGSLLEEEKR